MTDQKWRSPHGHAIASDVTDTIPTTASDEVSFVMPVVSNEQSLLAEAVKVIEFYADNWRTVKSGETLPMGEILTDKGTCARDFLAKIGEQNGK